jgi:hypothetical protein
MKPSDYYHGAFQAHLRSFWRSLENHGSVSRVRTGLNASPLAAQSAMHFSVVDLVARPDRGLHDHLADLPRDSQIDFLCALLYAILIDQVMYSHRPEDYAAFQAMTLYPKMDRTVGFSRTLMMANPYELLEGDVLASRGIEHDLAHARFVRWVSFIVDDLHAFFSQRKVGSTTWSDVRTAMLSDPDATWGQAGAALAASLASDSRAA